MKHLRLLSLEHSHAAYLADFAFYAGAVLVLAAALLVGCPRAQWLEMAGLTVAGLASWSAIEYALHRFVLHGLQPFKSWHAVHHHYNKQFGCYGVTSAFWDHVFGSAYQAPNQLPNKSKLQANTRKTLRTRNVLLTTHVNTNNNGYWP